MVAVASRLDRVIECARDVEEMETGKIVDRS
jgi:hypothetical protein